MPIYVYELVTDDEGEREQYEFFQKMSDPSLTEHPETGKPIHRVVAVPNVPGKHSPQSTEKMLSDKNLDRLGFTKYVKTSKGEYEKRTGKGPDNLSAYGQGS